MPLGKRRKINRTIQGVSDELSANGSKGASGEKNEESYHSLSALLLETMERSTHHRFPFSFSAINRRTKCDSVTFSRRQRSTNLASVGSSSRTVTRLRQRRRRSRVRVVHRRSP
jgi:hypothetical protein